MATLLKQVGLGASDPTTLGANTTNSTWPDPLASGVSPSTTGTSLRQVDPSAHSSVCDQRITGRDRVQHPVRRRRQRDINAIRIRCGPSSASGTKTAAIYADNSGQLSTRHQAGRTVHRDVLSEQPDLDHGQPGPRGHERHVLLAGLPQRQRASGTTRTTTTTRAPAPPGTRTRRPRTRTRTQRPPPVTPTSSTPGRKAPSPGRSSYRTPTPSRPAGPRPPCTPSSTTGRTRPS